MKVCFFARVESPEVLDRVLFYAQDIRALREIADEVVIATRPTEIPGDCDVYFVWWWTYALLPILRARIAGKRVVITGTFDYASPPRGAGAAYVDRPWWQRFLLRVALLGADANIFVSEYELNLVPSKLPVRGPVYSPHSVDVDSFPFGSGPRERFIFNLAWSGKINAQRKCLFEVVRAMPMIRARHPDVVLRMAGKPGEADGELRALAAELGVADSIEFLGVIDEAEKIRQMQRCAVYLSPTLYEGFGLAIAEAMSCGAAVVTSPEGAVPEVVGDAGLLVNGREPEAIASAVNRLFDDPVLAADLGCRARDRIVSTFPYERRRRELAEVLTGLVPASR